MRLEKILKRKRILVIGDIMLDKYYYGTVDRISPEAPVPVFLEKEVSYRLGGAANVAVNMAVNEQDVSMMSIIGNDENGHRMKKLLEENNINHDYLVSVDRITSTKSRLWTKSNQQVLRIDAEDTCPINYDLEKRFFKILEEKISTFDIVIISDYLKGMLTFRLTQKIISEADKYALKVLVDVKDKNFEKYKGAYLLKPNRKELSQLTSMPTDTLEEVSQAASFLYSECKSRYVLTTCGDKGMLLVGRDGGAKWLDAIGKEVFDVTGAGDTVIAYLAMSLANNIHIEDAMTISNYAAGIQVSKVGTSNVTIDEVAALMGKYKPQQDKLSDKIVKGSSKDLRNRYSHQKIVFTNGCFDILHVGHIRYLKKAASLGDVLLVGVNSDASVRRLKGENRPINGENDRAELLAEFPFVDHVIIFDEDTPYKVIQDCQPDILVKGGDYKITEVVGKDIVEASGGRVEILTFEEGKSTTNIIDKIKNSII